MKTLKIISMSDVIGIPMTIVPKSPLFWIIILCIVGFIVYKFFIHYNKDQTSTQKMEINVIKHVAKTLLQVEYMKRHNVSTDWIIDYINKKQRMPDKAEETLVSNTRETYELMFNLLRDYAADGNKNHLRNIKRCIDMQQSKIDIFEIQTGFASEKEFTKTYNILGRALVPGKVYEAYYANDSEGNTKLEVCYIPRIRFFDYFDEYDFDMS